MHLVVIAVLSLVLALPDPWLRWLTDPAHVLTATAVATVLPAVVGLLAGRHALHRLEVRPDDPRIGQRAYVRGLVAAQWLLGLGQAGLIGLTDWLPLCRRLAVVGDWPVLPGLIGTVPLLVSILLLWIALYPVDRAVRQIALEEYLLRGRPVRPVWPLREYLVFNLRHQVLFIYIPMVLILAARDVLEMYREPLVRLAGHSYFPDLLLGAAAGLVALCAPVILRYVWVTRRLADGPLRDRLLALCRQLRLRCREILVWRSGGMLVNAAVMGVIAPLRYVLITDAMLEQLDDSRIEAVFGHEAGHIKRHHILLFLLFAFISGCIVTLFSLRAPQMDPGTYPLAATAVGALLFFKWAVVFGWISRRFERQADVFGVRTLALAGLPCARPCALHDAPDAPRPSLRSSQPLCASAAHVFGDTLNEVALLNGIPPEARSWRHSSISSRSRFVQALAADPRELLRFERHVLLVQLAIVATALLCAVWTAWELRLWTLVGW